MAIAVDQDYDKAQRKISTANLKQFAGVDCQLLVEKETHRPIIMDGVTVGGKFKCASTDEVKAVETVANNAISQAYADEHYLGKTAKAVSAGTADTATTAGSATKATRDANNNIITSTYATKTEVTSGLSGKLGKTEKASSASTADAVAWTGVSGKPSFATVATSGNYNDLKNKPYIPTTSINTTVTGAGVIISNIRKSNTFNNTFTAPSYGIVSLHAIEGGSAIRGWQYLYVNSYAVYSENDVDSWAESGHPSLVFPVKTGDVIQADSEIKPSYTWNGFFIPCW